MPGSQLSAPPAWELIHLLLNLREKNIFIEQKIHSDEMLSLEIKNKTINVLRRKPLSVLREPLGSKASGKQRGWGGENRHLLNAQIPP